MVAEQEVERLVARLTGDGTSFQRMMRDAQVAAVKTGAVVEQVGKRISRVGDTMTRVGKKMSIALTAPLVVIGDLAVRESAKFETSLVKMRALVGLSSDTVAGLKKEILDLSGAVGKGPTELSDAMFNITSAGLRGEAAMTTLTATAKASAAGMGDITVVADAVTSAVNAYGSANLDGAKATDVLVAAVREGKAEAATFAPVMGQVLPLAQAMGIEFSEAAGSIAFLTKSTGNASLAATGLKATMAALIKPTSEAEKQYKKMGLTAEGLQQSVKDKGLLTTLQDLKASAEAQNIPMSELFTSVEALNAVLSMTGPNAAEAAKVIENVGNSAGITDDAFSKVEKTLAHQLSVTWVNLKKRLIEIGDILAPWVAKFNAGFKKVFEIWDSLGDSIKRVIVIVGVVVAAIGPLLIGAGMFISLVGGVITGISALIPIVVTLFTTILPAFIALLPVIITIGAGIAAVTAAVIGMGIVIKKVIGDDNLRAWFAAGKEAAFDFVVKVKGFFANFGENMKILWAWLKANWKNLLLDIGRFILAFVRNVPRNFVVMVETIVRVFSVLGGFLAENVPIWFTNAFNKAANVVLPIWGRFWDKFVTLARSAIDKVSKLFFARIQNLATTLSAAMEGDLAGVQAGIKKDIDLTLGILGTDSDTLAKEAVRLGQQFSDDVKKGAESEDIFKSIREIIGEQLKKLTPTEFKSTTSALELIFGKDILAPEVEPVVDEVAKLAEEAEEFKENIEKAFAAFDNQAIRDGTKEFTKLQNETLKFLAANKKVIEAVEKPAKEIEPKRKGLGFTKEDLVKGVADLKVKADKATPRPPSAIAPADRGGTQKLEVLMAQAVGWLKTLAAKEPIETEETGLN